MISRIGNCRIVGEIGSGGMAVVYKAVQEQLGRVVALKVLKPTIASDSQFAKRFAREARFMASLQHENILHVYDFVHDADETYILMEYVDGVDLFDLLDRRPVMPADVAATIALQVARAIDYSHFRGVVHRDIKPANIMVSRQGQVKLMDFGIAHDESLSEITDAGAGLGTPSYMSPEQILGDRLDFRSDMFSLGIVLYQMVTGTKPFLEEENRPVMQKIRLDKVASARRVNPTIPKELERIIARCMQKMPSNRYPTSQALIEALTDFLNVHLHVNQNARLVMYMGEIGVLDKKQARETLSNSGGPKALRRKLSVSGRAMGLWGGALFSGFLVAVILVLWSHGNVGKWARRLAGGAALPREAAELVPREAAHLHVVVHPWAVVRIAGREVMVTPSAQAIALTPGKYTVELQHPDYAVARRSVQLRPDETRTLFVDLTL